MKNAYWGRILALLLALTLLASALGVAEEDALSNDVVTLEESSGAEAMPEEFGEMNLLDTLGEVPEAAPEATPAPGQAAEVQSRKEKGGGEDVSESTKKNGIPDNLTIGVKEKYTIDTSGLSGKLTFKSSKTAVATVSSKGVITGKKAGTAKITITPKGGSAFTIAVTVMKAPSKVTLNKTSATLNAGVTLQLKATLPAKTASYKLTWSSSNAKVAKVSASGVVTAVAAGTAKITVKTFNGKKATCKVTVKKAKKLFSISPASVSLAPGETKSIAITYYGNESIWYAFDKAYNDLISCQWDSNWYGDTTYLYVTGKSAGKVPIYIFDDSYETNGQVETISVTVTSPSPTPTTPTDGTVTYRALLIGEENFYNDYCPRNRGDVGLMATMLGSVKGLYGGKYTVTRKFDLNKSGVLSAISTAFAGADDNDVSLFFIASHGDSSSTGVYAGALAMSPSGDLLLTDLANALKAVRGKVIVVLESCGAGAAIYGNGKGGAEAMIQSIEAFDKAAVEAFAAVDPGIEVVVEPGEIASDGLKKNTGEFRIESKFCVLCCSRYQEVSWGGSDYNYFTKWLTDGIGTSGNMPADANKNGQATLNEVYSYISKVGDNYGMWDGRTYNYQHVQVYPANSSYVLFVR